jgi:ABC-type transport system involved in cytochrome c biogenesis permease subunit
MSTTATINWFRFASPASFYPLAGRFAPWFGIAAAILAAAGLWLGLVVAPTDAQQGEAYRIIFIHVPAAWMSMFIYLVMAFWCAISLGFNARLAAMLAQALAPTGALFTAIALWTGALWGKPTWGTYWAWDARMTSELILLFLYFGYCTATRGRSARQGDRASSYQRWWARSIFRSSVLSQVVETRTRRDVSLTAAEVLSVDGTKGVSSCIRHSSYSIAVVLVRVRRSSSNANAVPWIQSRTMISLNDLVAMRRTGYCVLGLYRLRRC